MSLRMVQWSSFALELGERLKQFYDFWIYSSGPLVGASYLIYSAWTSQTYQTLYSRIINESALPNSWSKLACIQQAPSIHVVGRRKPHVQGDHGGGCRVSIRAGVVIITTGNIFLLFCVIILIITYRALVQLASCLSWLSLLTSDAGSGWVTRLTS